MSEVCRRVNVSNEECGRRFGEIGKIMHMLVKAGMTDDDAFRLVPDIYDPDFDRKVIDLWFHYDQYGTCAADLPALFGCVEEKHNV